MKKIPTVFERDWDGDRSRVIEKVTPGCEWVLEGEGVATRKYDGSACLIREGRLYRRESVPVTKEPPDGFIEVEIQSGDGDKPDKRIGWLPVGDGPQDRWHREAIEYTEEPTWTLLLAEGTYELVGPKVQGNPEGFEKHTLVRHSDAEQLIVPRTFEAIRDMLATVDVEGFVFVHPDGRMAKVKARDFGIKRPVKSKESVTA